MFTYSFGVDGVHSKQQRRHQAGSLVQEYSAHSQKKHTYHSMQNNVEQMIGSCTQLTEEVVHSKCEYGEGSVRFVAPLLYWETYLHVCCQMWVSGQIE